MNDAGPFASVGKNIECVFTMIESKSKQIIPNMGWICGSGLTRANVPQTSLAINSGATIGCWVANEVCGTFALVNPLPHIHPILGVICLLFDLIMAKTHSMFFLTHAKGPVSFIRRIDDF